MPKAPRAKFTLTLAALALVCVCAIPAGAGARGARTLGLTKHTPAPACPGDPCEVVGSVSGLQTVADGKQNAYKAHVSGKIVSFAVLLSRPKKSQRSFFGGQDIFGTEAFGATPTVRLSVLKQVGKRRYQLKRQSPIVPLGNALGGPYFVSLNDPLRIVRGQFVAVSTPTWMPAFRPNLPTRRNQWIASRPAGNCGGDTATQARPQQKKGSKRQYGCRFTGARILYRAYYVKKQLGKP